MVTLIKDDLVHILKQIKLAEEHTRLINEGMNPAAALAELVSSPLLPTGLRTVDGAYNNFGPGYTYSGASDVPMTRLLDMSWVPAEANPRTGQQTSYESYNGSVYDSQPRIISNLVADQTLNNPAAIAGALASVGITGAENLALVRQIMDLQAAAKAAQDAVAGAVAAAQGAANAAQLAVDAAEASLTTAQSQADAAALAHAAAQTAVVDAQEAYDLAVAALQVQSPSVVDQQAAAAAALTSLQAAQAAAQATQQAMVLAFANLGAAQQVEASALSAFQANNTPENATAYFNAVDARQAASAAYATANEADEDADEALVGAQSTHASAVGDLQAALQVQQGLESVLDLAANALALSQANLASANAQLATANAQVTSAEGALEAAQAALDSIPVGTEATAAAQAVADAAEQAVLDELSDHGVTMDGSSVFIKNVAADLGDTASFNGFMTIFGQFFDHGLDLTAKGGSGTVYVPLQPDDPLYIPGSATNFMVLTRATNGAGDDGILGTSDDIREHRNETTPWTDLNQVYTSNASHQVFLREYVMVGGKPVATGHMLEGEAGGPPTWKDIKDQARDMLGIELSDFNVHAVPAVLTDLYGEFVRGTNGFPQLVMPGIGAVEGNLLSPIDAMQAASSGRAFLNDIAHSAAPGQYVVSRDMQTGAATYAMQAPDGDSATGNAQAAPNMFGGVSTYDNELLDRHFIVGDGRGNENIVLTAVHTIFHGEHNRQVEEIKHSLIEAGDIAFLNQWLAVPVTAIPANLDSLVWDGERLFQAARFSTEMVYQHLVFEEFVRAIAPQIDPFVFSNSVEIDGAIFEEFAQVVYRFGHSMLNENVEMLSLLNGAASPHDESLMEAFLNPVMFDQQGVTAQEAAGAILRGMTRQAGNEIDEFVTDALRNNLVGLPLDLATINLTRARETGVPSLNEARRQIFEQTNDTYLKPYASWTDFAQNIKNPLSIVNFIAAYGTHASILAATTVEAKRDAAWNLVFGVEGETVAQRNARLDFLNATGTWANDATLGGLNKVDFWIGGLAESLMPFGGMLGATFTFVFELQIQNLQNGDRFYYLSRTQGMNLLTELESDSFADVIRRNTDTGDTGLHINGAAFQTADYIISMDQTKQYNPGLGSADPTAPGDVLAALTGADSLVVRHDLDGDGDTDYIKYLGGEHVVIGGTNEDDIIIGGAGDDTIWGEGGNDRIEGGFGVDHIHGGDGDDIITDSGTDVGAADVIKGEGGDDVINGGMGLDLIFGGAGSDVLSGGSEAKSIFGGTGDDFIRAASGGGGVVLGNEGNDWMEGQGNMNTLSGDNSELFFNSRIIGHDIMLSGENDTDFDGESGDDIMVQGIGINRNNGMAGFDWVTFKDNNYAVDADMNVGIFTNQQNNILRDRYDLVEGLSGWKNDDKLTGREVVVGAYDASGNAAQIDADAPIESFSNVLLEKNLDLIKGLRELVEHLERFDVWNPHNLNVIQPEDEDDEPILEVIDPTSERLVGVMDTSDGSDILLGGGGSDTIRGMAGNDIIDGDKWLDVYIAIKNTAGEVFATARSLTAQVIDLITEQPLFNGRTLESLLFSRDIRPSQLEATREIKDGGQEGDVDTAVYWDVFENYEITRHADGSVTVAHMNPGDAVIDPATGRAFVEEGVDRLFNIELLQFADRTVDLRIPTLQLQLNGFDSEARNWADNFNTTSLANNTGTTNFAGDWVETNDTGGAAGGSIRIDNGSNELRFSTGNANNAAITRQLDLAGANSATVSFEIDDSNIGGNDDEELVFEFAADGSTFVEIRRFDGGNNGPHQIDLPTDLTFGANAAIRFRMVNQLDSNEWFSVDNLVINATILTPAATPTIDHAFTYVEQAQPQSIASLPDIVSQANEIVSARVVLTNPRAGDTLSTASLAGTGVTSSVALVAGQIVLTLTGPGSPLAFESAIQAVRFSNNTDNPGAETRIIHTTVNDGSTDSNVAITTVTVVPINDAPQAANDTIVTNITGDFALPEWALLNNDVDLDGPALDITSVSESQTNFAVSLGADNTVVFGRNTNDARNFTYAVNDGSGAANATDTANASISYDSNGITASDNGNTAQILVGDGDGDTFDAGLGNDIIFAGGGNDTIVWNANNSGATDGRDFVDGGSGIDTFDVNTRSGTTESFRVYTVAEALSGPNAIIGLTAAGLRPGTEIVITRTTGGQVDVGSIIAELASIEEIRIGSQNADPTNGSAGAGDTVAIFGDFTQTSLALNTITIDGSDGDDTVDISSLTSAHRIVFRANGGNDTIIGQLRPQDVIELPPGANPDDFVRAYDEETGMSTLSDGVYVISYSGNFAPNLGLGDGDDHHGDDDHYGDDDDNDHDIDDDEDEDDDGDVDTDGSGLVPPVLGTPAGGVLMGTSGADLIFGMDGVDYVLSGAAADIIRLAGGDDFADAGAGNDVVWAGSGDDDVLGGRGNDMLYGEAGNDWISGDAGHDMIDGGAGDDHLFGGDGNDKFIGRIGDGNDHIDGGAGVDTLDLGSLTAAVHVNLGTGIDSRGHVTGTQSGTDTLYGVENVTTGSGNDTIVASNDVNIMDGGAGEDVFVFGSAAAANGDTILNFEAGDKVDLAGMLSGASSFALVNGSPAAGQIAITHEVREDGEYTVVTGNTDGGEPDFRISITGNHNLTSSDFNL